MTLIDVYCEACGKGIAIPVDSQARHVLCPLRRYGTKAPRYVTYRNSPPAQAQVK